MNASTRSRRIARGIVKAPGQPSHPVWERGGTIGTRKKRQDRPVIGRS